MKFKLGDFVRFVDEDLEGHITSFMPNDLVGVTGADGFEIPVQANKITHVHGQLTRHSADEEGEADEQVATAGPFITEGIDLAIVGDTKQGLAMFYLINGTSYEMLVSFNTVKGQDVTGEFRGTVAPHATVQLYMANLSNIGNWPELNIQGLFHAPVWKLPKSPLDVKKRIRPADLSTPKQHIASLDTKAWVFRLDQPAPSIDTEKLREHFISHRPTRGR
ncbi:DUF2027 domain-containing protein [Parapedobacter tibetensis]|uniref:DUF2027 domain-containing protein n=1 Tax=Parapedobacter tibetensis TaxID=2972951 RepID=UPI00214D1803|nr:DUF2027 domain-containing protein [Parapedobacter tibetensis]